MYLTSTRKSDGKVLYFRNMESRLNWIDMYDGEDELLDLGFVQSVPITEDIIYADPLQAELENVMGAVGLSMKDMTKQTLYGLESEDKSYEKTDERLKEYKNMAKQSYELVNHDLVEIEDNPQEINIRKSKVLQNRLFRSFVQGLEDDRRILVAEVFKNHDMDIDKLDEYLDEELNMDLSVYLQDYETQYQFDWQWKHQISMLHNIKLRTNRIRTRYILISMSAFVCSIVVATISMLF